MYSPEKMMSTGGNKASGPGSAAAAAAQLHGSLSAAAATGGCFPGRYSPTYRSPEPMPRRCMPNPSVSAKQTINPNPQKIITVYSFILCM